MLSALRLDVLPLDILRCHMAPGGTLSDVVREGSPLRGALSDVLLPGVRQLRVVEAEGDAPHDLVCVITMELFVDPVIATDGARMQPRA